MKGRVLIVAGSDSGGGAGIQADIKAVTALGRLCHDGHHRPDSAQNTLGVHDIHGVPEDFITRQIEVVLSDLGADAFKTGMLHSPAVIRDRGLSAGSRCGAPHRGRSGHAGQGRRGTAPTRSAQAALVELLLPRATLLTPNVPEAEALTGLSIQLHRGPTQAVGERLLALGPKAVLMKGGHLDRRCYDRCAGHRRRRHASSGWAESRRNTPHTHGTGCTLASAPLRPVWRSQLTLQRSVERAVAYVDRAIRAGAGLRAGPRADQPRPSFAACRRARRLV